MQPCLKNIIYVLIILYCLGDIQSVINLIIYTGDDFQSMADFMAALNDVITRRQRSQILPSYTASLSSKNANEDEVDTESQVAAGQRNANANRQLVEMLTDARHDSKSFQNYGNPYSDEKRKQFEEKNHETMNTYDWVPTTKKSTQRNAVGLNNSSPKQFYSEQGIL